MARDVSRSEDWGPNFMLPLGSSETIPPNPPVTETSQGEHYNEEQLAKDGPRDAKFGVEREAPVSLNSLEYTRESDVQNDEDDDHAHRAKGGPRDTWAEVRRCCGKVVQPAYSRTYFFYRDRPQKQRRLLMNAPDVPTTRLVS